jgi:outer membrane protein OmpA-like peptidoglycan-associated protein
MKKIILLSVFALVGTLTMTAQTTAVPSGSFFDNWYLGSNMGAVMKLKNAGFFKSARPIFGLTVGKQWTPVMATEIQGLAYINTTNSSTAIDATDVSLIGKMNLMNLFGEYTGEPSFFEIETVTGLGWLHHYVSGAGDTNDLTARTGLSLNFNLGESKAWTLSIKPAMVYNLTGNYPAKKLGFDINRANMEILVGFTYHLPNSYGEHYMPLLPVIDPLSMDAINADINALRLVVAERDAELVSAAQNIESLQKQLADCQDNQEVVVSESVTIAPMPETIITFRQGSAVVENLQLPDVERVAGYLKDNPSAKILITGYASPEGSLEFNQQLSQKRADTVKSILMQQYNISADRITAEGKGIGDFFPQQPDWNRLSICIIDGAE